MLSDEDYDGDQESTSEDEEECREVVDSRKHFRSLIDFDRTMKCFACSQKTFRNWRSLKQHLETKCSLVLHKKILGVLLEPEFSNKMEAELPKEKRAEVVERPEEHETLAKTSLREVSWERELVKVDLNRSKARVQYLTEQLQRKLKMQQKEHKEKLEVCQKKLETEREEIQAQHLELMDDWRRSEAENQKKSMVEELALREALRVCIAKCWEAERGRRQLEEHTRSEELPVLKMATELETAWAQQDVEMAIKDMKVNDDLAKRMQAYWEQLEQEAELERQEDVAHLEGELQQLQLGAAEHERRLKELQADSEELRRRLQTCKQRAEEGDPHHPQCDICFEDFAPRDSRPAHFGECAQHPPLICCACAEQQILLDGAWECLQCGATVTCFQAKERGMPARKRARSTKKGCLPSGKGERLQTEPIMSNEVARCCVLCDIQMELEDRRRAIEECGHARMCLKCAHTVREQHPDGHAVCPYCRALLAKAPLPCPAVIAKA